MKAKYVIGLPAIILSAGLALGQQPAPPPAPDEPESTFSIFIDGGGFLGVYGENISRENMARYGLSQPRGVGITQVMADSPAERASLRKDDVILRIDGDNVTSVRKLNRLVSEIAPDQSAKITISRNGAEQEVTATIGKRKDPIVARDLFSPEPRTWKFEGPKTWKFEGPMVDTLPNDGDLPFMFGNSRRIGVSTVELTKQLAEYFGVADRRGVLVTSVSADGPAAKAGLKAGDVITAVDGEAVDSPGDIARVINRKKEGEVSLTVIRNRAQQTIRVTPSQGASTGMMRGEISRTIRDQIRNQVGRQIVIPRIEFPDINISVPPINIEVPRVKINPGAIRVSRGVYGPI